jgi:hypothetical protein
MLQDLEPAGEKHQIWQFLVFFSYKSISYNCQNLKHVLATLARKCIIEVKSMVYRQLFLPELILGFFNSGKRVFFCCCVDSFVNHAQ